MSMNIESLLHRRLLPSLLVLCLVGMGPAALASLPRSVSPNAEEETRTHTQTADGVLWSAIRVAKTAGRGDRPNRPENRRVASVNRVRSGLCTISLRTLQVRIQV